MRVTMLMLVGLLAPLAHAQAVVKDIPPNPRVDQRDRRILYAIGVTNDLDPKLVRESKDQLKQAISDLTQIQFFNVVPCGRDRPLVDGIAVATRPVEKDFPHLDAEERKHIVRGVVVASPDGKTRAYKYIDELKPLTNIAIRPVVDQLIVGPNWEVCYVLIFAVPPDMDDAMKKFTEQYKGKVKVNIIFGRSATDSEKKALLRWPEMTGGVLKILEMSGASSPATQPTR